MDNIDVDSRLFHEKDHEHAQNWTREGMALDMWESTLYALQTKTKGRIFGGE
jgi:hypothetical protein